MSKHTIGPGSTSPCPRNSLLASRTAAAYEKVRQHLLAERNKEGHWTGELSSSALSTATAVCALQLIQTHQPSGAAIPAASSGGLPPPGSSAVNDSCGSFHDLIWNGLEWLAGHANEDGGWGDTVLSLSNISTTTLAWAAFGAVPGAPSKFKTTIKQAEHWLAARAGGIDPENLSRAIIQRYGKDRTFSVPILTMCALAGRLGAGEQAWRHVLPLPFELAAVPPRLFAFLRLPVVSYALPALIAMGQAHHFHAPSGNPLLRVLRNALKNRTLSVLENIQPSSGGFLEATPLTSFVAMSLAASGQAQHPVVRLAASFLEDSVREDGSWPIDSNLATWVTTLSVNALAANEQEGLPIDERQIILEWLLDQQYKTTHPYTQAAPGGWAWTNLPGGVPDADDTAGALLAIHALAQNPEALWNSVRTGLEWLVNLQNRDGGIPTFCRGWGYLPFDRSSPDLTAHAMRAWRRWRPYADASTAKRLNNALGQAFGYLQKSQQPDGAWIPLWFGNQFAFEDENRVYGTARVLQALNGLPVTEFPQAGRLALSGADWLFRNQNGDGSWGCGSSGSIEETALAIEALAEVQNASQEQIAAFHRGLQWLVENVHNHQFLQPAPIGFYFANLWYYERLYPQIFTAAALATQKGQTKYH